MTKKNKQELSKEEQEEYIKQLKKSKRGLSFASFFGAVIGWTFFITLFALMIAAILSLVALIKFLVQFIW